MNRRDFVRLMGGAVGLALTPAPVAAVFDPKSWPTNGWYGISYYAHCPELWAGVRHIKASYSAVGELLKVLVDGEVIPLSVARLAPWIPVITEDGKFSIGDGIANRSCLIDDRWLQLASKPSKNVWSGAANED